METGVTILAEKARAHPDKLFVRFRDADLSYAAFEDRTRRFAAGLRRHDVGGLNARRDRRAVVPTLLPNCADAAVLWFAANRAGAVWAPINTGFRGSGLSHAINLTRSPDLIVDRSLVDAVHDVADELRWVKRLIVRGGARAADATAAGAADARPPGEPTEDGLARLRAGIAADVLPLTALDLADDGAPAVVPDSAAEPSLLLYTSGTTGRSKACELSHRYVVGHARLLSGSLGMRHDDVLFCPYPIFHWDATIGTIAPALALGATAVVTERFSVSRFWEDVRRYGATVFDFMGATLTFLHKQPRRPDDADNPARLAWGVPMPAFRNDFEERFGVTLVEGYGSTELGIAVVEKPGCSYPPGACGRTLPAFQLRIVDDDGRPLPAGEIGEIAARPAPGQDRHLMLTGYYRMPERNDEALRGGWLHTGDLGRLDEGGNLYFEGRRKDAIRRRGENISAFEIEQVVEAHPAVLEVAAYGVPSEYTEEEVAVSIVLRPGRTLSTEQLLAHCRGRMARYMIPEHVRFLEALPKTPTEKIAKSMLKQSHAESLKARARTRGGTGTATALAAVLALGPTLGACTADAPPQVRTEPLSLDGTSPVEWSGSQRSSHFVTADDGVRLAVDVVLPAGYAGEGEPPSSFPVVFRYTPYHRTSIDPASGTVSIAPFEFFLARGYAYVAADMRGSGASYGWNDVMSRAIVDDAGILVDWIAAQPWSDGNVGMFGGSYEGWSQFAAAAAQPEALKAIVPIHTGWDGMLVQPGGIFSYAFTEMWTAMTDYINHNNVFPTFPVPPVTPVLDEDGDGELLDEIPLDADGDGWFTDDYRWPVDPGDPPIYPDGEARTEHAYFNATLEHVAHAGGAPGNYDAVNSLRTYGFSDTPRKSDGLTPPDLNWGLLPDVMESGVAIYNFAGWWDAFARSSFEVFATLEAAPEGNPTRIIAWPMYHQGISPAASTAIGADPARENIYTPAYLGEALRWYDRWLKGIPNGIDYEPPVHIFVQNEGWRAEEHWPLEDEERVRLHLAAEGMLLPEPGEGGADEYLADFTHDGSFGPPLDATEISVANRMRGRPDFNAASFGHSRQQMFGVPGDLPYRTDKAAQTLHYTSAPFEADTEVTGHPVVSVAVSSTADYGDLYFYLEDVDPAGNAVLVTEYQHRAGFNRLVDNDLVVPGGAGIDVRPDLPWHGFRVEDYTDGVFADGAVVRVTTALYPTSWLFRTGHRVRLSIAAADWPVFDLHPRLSPRNRPDADDNTVPTLTIHRGGDRPSHVELPVIAR